MLLLTSTSSLLRVVTSGAADISVHASWVDNLSDVITPGASNTNIASATTTTVCGSPAPSTQRTIQTLNVRNTHATTANTVTVQHTDGITAASLFSLSLAAGEALTFVDGDGWAVFTATGARKYTASANAADLTGTTLAANIVNSSLLTAAGGSFGTAAFTAATAYDAAGTASGLIATHAALTTGVHGLAITAGQTLTVTTGGTLGSAAYTAATAYDVAGAAAAITPTTLGLVIGTNTQAHAAKLDTFVALADAAGWLHSTGAGVYAWSTPTKSDVGLSAVENTALSTWAGTSSITTVGTLASGAVPASLVTAGTFGAGAYTFPGDLTVGASTFVVTAATGAVAVTGRIAANGGTAADRPFSASTTNVAQGYGSYFGGVGASWTSIANEGLVTIDVAGVGVGQSAFHVKGNVSFFDISTSAAGCTATIGGSLAITGALTGVTTVNLTTQPAFVAGDKYLVIDASGNVHVSAVGPAS